MRSGGSLAIFWESPIAMVLIILAGLLFFWNLYRSLRPTKAPWEKILEEG
jgi:TctA family transporter